jgi:hypothetical protein
MAPARPPSIMAKSGREKKSHVWSKVTAWVGLFFSIER